MRYSPNVLVEEFSDLRVQSVLGSLRLQESPAKPRTGAYVTAPMLLSAPVRVRPSPMRHHRNLFVKVR